MIQHKDSSHLLAFSLHRVGEDFHRRVFQGDDSYCVMKGKIWSGIPQPGGYYMDLVQAFEALLAAIKRLFRCGIKDLSPKRRWRDSQL